MAETACLHEHRSMKKKQKMNLTNIFFKVMNNAVFAKTGKCEKA